MSDMLDRLRTRKRLPLVNVALFLVTTVTVLISGAVLSLPESGQADGWGFLASGVPFAASLIGILFCHEMGHYLMARTYGVDSTLPFFIPFAPFPFGIGTLGAVIRIRSALPTRRAVLDIGAAGPIAGFLVALPLLAWGYAHSKVEAVPVLHHGAGSPYEVVREILDLVSRGGTIWQVVQDWWRQPSGTDGLVWQFGDSVITRLVQQWTFGSLPAGHDVVVHPVAIAAWFGLFVTALNLFPIGQLDGGHVIYALWGRRGAHLVSRFTSAGLLAAGFFFSWNWFVWWALTRFVVGLRHPPALQEEPLAPGRRALAIAALVLFAATFIPVPMSA
jgi:membrane-associated protease RseP (regulator of RpoE activity)